MPLQVGLTAKFQVASDVTFDTGGTDDGNGGFTWDMAQSFAGDQATLIETLPIAGQWFESDFAGATYAARLSDGEDLLGVFEITSTQLLLRGVVTPEGGAFQTNLDYDPPVVVLEFPFQQGDSWTTDSTVSGLALGIIAVYSEEYTSSVDKHGTAQTPFGDFPALRVHTEMVRTQGLATLEPNADPRFRRRVLRHRRHDQLAELRVEHRVQRRGRGAEAGPVNPWRALLRQLAGDRTLSACPSCSLR